ncbi:hypothetical protein [Collinsella stercoris]|uniref:hypothetical protein n=1 Tax=Collinsella stercoris TaxID=147206 RepID=UPI003AEF4D10
MSSVPYFSSSQAISRQRFIVALSSVAAPAFGRLVAPVWMDAGAPSPNSHGSAAFGFSMSLPWSGRRVRAALTLRTPASYGAVGKCARILTVPTPLFATLPPALEASQQATPLKGPMATVMDAGSDTASIFEMGRR